MFSRTSCYFFVRPKKSFLEVCVFLPRALKAPQVRAPNRASKIKFANLIQIRHRDEVEPPITDWLQEAYDFAGAQAAKPASEEGARKQEDSVTPNARLARSSTRCTTSSIGMSVVSMSTASCASVSGEAARVLSD